jgi:uncharacterized protein (TIGR02996 family)
VLHSEKEFVAAIRANPDDDTARLVYADWLDEKGERENAQRALSIRVLTRPAQFTPPPAEQFVPEIEWAFMAGLRWDGGAGRHPLEQHLVRRDPRDRRVYVSAEGYVAYRKWLELDRFRRVLGRDTERGGTVFDRGLLTAADLYPHTWARVGNALYESQPIRRLRLLACPQIHYEWIETTLPTRGVTRYNLHAAWADRVWQNDEEVDPLDEAISRENLTARMNRRIARLSAAMAVRNLLVMAWPGVDFHAPPEGWLPVPEPTAFTRRTAPA